jgi:hypothetical protein
LWCETWCSDETKASAKAIDLCNNPQTKMSKLEIAMRVEGWSELDQEIKNMEKAAFSGGLLSDEISEVQIQSSNLITESWMEYSRVSNRS